MHTLSPHSSTLYEKLQRRSQAFAAVRAFFTQRNFWEVDTPMLASTAVPDPHIDPVQAQVHLPTQTKTQPFFLHTSPELPLKRALAHGAQRIYQLSHVFRDGEVDRLHRVEFTLLEWYRVQSNMQQLIVDCQQLFAHMHQQLNSTKPPTKVEFSAKLQKPSEASLQWNQPFEQATMQQLWQRHAGIDLALALQHMQQGNPHALVQAVKQAGFTLREHPCFEDAFTHVMLTRIEPKIGQQRPCVVTHWPAQMACLAQLCPHNPLFAQRFEIYAGGVELANGFVELTNPVQQRQRFEQDNAQRQRMGKPTLPLDEQFLHDLQHVPPCVGVAVGFDRVLMLHSNGRNLQDVLLF